MLKKVQDLRMVLRMGNAQTPEEAIAELEAFKKATPDLASWEKQKAAIRQGILEGARLANLTCRTPPVGCGGHA